MKKTKGSRLFMVVSTMVIFSIMILLKLGRHHHKGVLESTGKDLDNRLKELLAALDKATLFVHHALNHAS